MRKRTKKSNGVINQSPDIVRLTVNLAPSVARALVKTSRKQGVTITEGVRRAIIIWKIISDAQAKKQRIMFVKGRGGNATYRELEGFN